MKPTTPIERDPARLQEMLPWYLNGTLAEDDRAWVEQVLAADEAQADADLQAQLDLDSSLARGLEQQVAQLPADIGWSSLLQRVRTDAGHDAAGQAVARGRLANSRSGRSSGAGMNWIQRLGRLLAPTLSPQVGMGLAVLVAVQAIAIGVLLGDREGGSADTAEYRSGGGTTQAAAIRALLNETITEKAMREALSANDARIVEGPNPLGEYWIDTGKRDPESVAAALRAAGVIATYVIDHRQQRR